VAAALCLRHPDTPAIGSCARCGASYCGACSVAALAAERVYCSPECRDVDARTGTTLGVDDRALAAGYNRPIGLGWKLFLRSIPVVAGHVWPVAVAMALVLWLGGSSALEAIGESQMSGLLVLANWMLFAYGAALTGVVLTQAHTGFDSGNPYLWALRRFIPWAVTWGVVSIIVLSGMLLFFIPGIVLGTRLFWADEFALVLSRSPGRAIRQSWELTRGHGWQIFGFQFVVGFVEYLVLIPVVILTVLVHQGALSTGFSENPLVQTVESTVLILLAFLAYGAAHAPELTYFYGLRATQTGTANEGEDS